MSTRSAQGEGGSFKDTADRRGELWCCMGGTARLLMDQKVVANTSLGVVAMVDVAWCSAAVVVAVV